MLHASLKNLPPTLSKENATKRISASLQRSKEAFHLEVSQIGFIALLTFISLISWPEFSSVFPIGFI
jgi:hypothetical protein